MYGGIYIYMIFIILTWHDIDRCKPNMKTYANRSSSFKSNMVIGNEHDPYPSIDESPNSNFTGAHDGT